MTAEEIITLAKLPSRQELLGMLAGGLLGTISKFAVAIDQVRMQKENAEGKNKLEKKKIINIKKMGGNKNDRRIIRKN